jgi:hypothetical protein
VDRLKAIGNGQVPLVAAVAFLGLLGRLKEVNSSAAALGGLWRDKE